MFYFEFLVFLNGMTKPSTNLITGWERKVHVTPSVDLYSGQILVRSMSGKFQSVYFCDLIIFTLRISASYQ